MATMLKALTLLLLFQLAGEVLSRLLALPVPGPVVGMALMFLLLLARGGPDSDLRETSNTLLSHLSLLFVPAGTGVLLHIQRVAEEWPRLPSTQPWAKARLKYRFRALLRRPSSPLSPLRSASKRLRV